MKQIRSRWVFQDNWLTLTIVLVSGVLGLLCIRSVQIGQPADDAVYLILAESLAKGRGLRLICFPSAPLEQWFPAGWPMLLAPIVLISQKNYELARILPFGFTIVSIAAVDIIGRLYWRREIRIASTLLFAVSPAVVLGAGSPMSEPAYMAFSFLAIVYIERLLVKQHADGRTLLVAGFLTAATIYIRTIGITLLAAAVIYLLLNHKTKCALVLLLTTLALLIPQIFQNIMAGGLIMSPNYQAAISGSFSERIEHILQNSGTYVTDIIPNLLIGLFGPRVDQLLESYRLAWAGVALKFAILSAVVIGFFWGLRKLRLYHIYVALFFGATSLYYNPVSGSALPRYLVPILPFLIASCLMGVIAIVRGLLRAITTPDKGNSLGHAAFITLIAAVALISVGRNIQQGYINPLKTRMTDVSAGASWISAHTNSSAIVAMPNPIPRYIYAQRKVVWFPSVSAPEDLLDWFESEGVTHLLIGPPLRPNLDISLDDYQNDVLVPLIRSHPENFRLDFADDRWNVKVFSIQ